MRPITWRRRFLVQGAALKKLNERVTELESRLVQQPQQQQPVQSSGGFLSGLFGSGSRQQPAAQQQQPVWNSTPQQPAQQPPQYANTPAAPAPRGSGFFGGALQTAVGVAGGVVMADMLTSMFHHSQTEKIVNIINGPPLTEVNDNLNTFNGGGEDTAFPDQNSGWDNGFADNSDLNDFGGNDFDDYNFV